LFLSEEEQGNDMYYMVTSLVEFTKKIINMAFKESLSWYSLWIQQCL